MYYPYLRGKQFELIALREFAEEIPTPSHVTPIIEPVKNSFYGLAKVADTLLAKNISFALILNPSDGDFKRETADLIENLPSLSINQNWIPAFLFNGNLNDIQSLIDRHKLNHVMIVFPESFDLNFPGLADFLNSNYVRFIVANLDNDRRNKRFLTESGKTIIRLDNQFNDKPRNADYLDVPEEKFTEEHRYYKDDGFDGFADYTTLPKSFKDSGMLPYAVAIHMTYIKSDDEIFVRHFVSDHNFSTANIQGKFFEAASKLQKFFSSVPNTPAVANLIDLLSANRYPGLGTIKKLSIKNHLELIENYLSSAR